jgi:hypothetical protein
MIKTGMAKNADEALDILTKGFQDGANKADDLLEVMTEYGTQFRKFGISGQQATGMLSQGLKAGARDADTVADAIGEFSKLSLSGSKDVADGFAAIGLNVGDMEVAIGKGGKSANDALDLTLDKLRAIEDPVDREVASIALFGTKAEDLGEALYAIDPSGAVASLGKVSGAAKTMADTLGSNPASALESFKRQAMNKLASISGVFAEFAMKNSSILMPVTFTILGVAAAITIVNGAIKAWQFATAAWTVIQIIATNVQLAWNLAIMANPVGLIIVAIFAFVAAIVVLYKKNETFRKFINASWQAIKATVSSVARWIGTHVPPAWAKITAAARATGSWIKTHVPPVWHAITNAFSAAKSRIVGAWNTIKNAAIGVKNYIASMPGRIGAAFSSMARRITAPFRGAFNTVISLYNSMARRLHISIPGWVPGIGGKSFSLPSIPGLASGGIATSSGLAMVGENGPELAFLGQGAGIAPLPRAGGGNTILEIRSGGDDFSRMLAEMIKKYVRVSGGGNVQTAFGR